MQYCYFDSPIGTLLLAGEDKMLGMLRFPSNKMTIEPDKAWKMDHTPFLRCIAQLQEYFAGQRKFFDVPYAVNGTAFQQRVLRAVAQVPYGTTKSYSAIATQIHSPLAMRAVGMANAQNPLPIIIPCHRIIGKNGKLTGFAGGLDIKSYLINLETKYANQ